MNQHETADMKTIPWVAGNTLNLAVPLQTITKNNGQETRQDYYPPAGSQIQASLVGTYRSYRYDSTLDGNVVRFTDPGTLPLGYYGIEITVKEPDNMNRRTFKCQQILIHNCTDDVMGTLPDGEALLDAAIFIQGQKGDKGDKGDQGIQGPPGTTDYNELENKPDLSVFMEAVTEEELNAIFN